MYISDPTTQKTMFMAQNIYPFLGISITALLPNPLCFSRPCGCRIQPFLICERMIGARSDIRAAHISWMKQSQTALRLRPKVARGHSKTHEIAVDKPRQVIEINTPLSILIAPNTRNVRTLPILWFESCGLDTCPFASRYIGWNL